MRKVGLVFGIGLLLLTAGCAGVAESPSEGSPGPTKGPATFTIGPQDSGATITMHIGDQLVFAPDESTSTPGGLAWTLLRYPGNLALTSDGKHVPFRFVARQGGTGKLEVTFGPLCGSPGPLTANGLPCPVLGPGDSQSPAGIPVRLVSITVQVYGQGS